MPQSTNLAPRSVLHRDAIAAADVVANVVFDFGLQTEDNEYVHFVVEPSGDANPSASVYYWESLANDGDGMWVVDADFTTLTGAGANIPYAFSVPARGRVILVALTVIASGAVNVFASGFGFSNRI